MANYRLNEVKILNVELFLINGLVNDATSSFRTIDMPIAQRIMLTSDVSFRFPVKS